MSIQLEVIIANTKAVEFIAPKALWCWMTSVSTWTNVKLQMVVAIMIVKIPTDHSIAAAKRATLLTEKIQVNVKTLTSAKEEPTIARKIMFVRISLVVLIVKNVVPATVWFRFIK